MASMKSCSLPSFLTPFHASFLLVADKAVRWNYSSFVMKIWMILWFAVVASCFGKAPNIILVMTDDQGYAPVGAHGHPWIKTPNMDKLHDTGTAFDRFLVSPTCSPTRSALMTGRHPMKNGITHTILERERMALGAVTLPQVLAKAGYKSGIFGKWHLGDEAEYQPESRGFDEVFIHGAGGIGQAYNCSCADAPGNKYFDPVIRHNGKFVKTKGFCTDVFFEKATSWIGKMKDGEEPFFAYIATNAPHAPYIAPEEAKERFLKMGFSKNEAGFYGMIENIDENLGKLMTQMDEWKLWEDTVFIFMSDNGMAGGVGDPSKVLGQGTDGSKLMGYNSGMKGFKGSLDEGGARVPFFIRWDGKTQAGKKIDKVVAHIDLLPTLAGLAGVEFPKEQVEGRDFWPLVVSDKAAWPARYLFDHKARWDAEKDPDLFKWQTFSVRGPKYRLVGKDQLFDIEADPGQQVNIAKEHPEKVKEMLSAYDKFWDEARPLMVNENVPMSKTRPYHVWYAEQLENGGIPLDGEAE
jgi:arylsulfatase A-like enzyme